MIRRLLLLPLLAAATLAGGASAASAAPCTNTGRFEPWLEAFRKDALKQGVTPATIASALGGMTMDPGIISRDRRQGFFQQTFLDFSDKLATKGRQWNARRHMERHRAVFERAEKEYGVPAPVITAFWALESDFGVGMGNLPVLRSLATLAYDCRRGEMFRGELMAALKIIDRGDLTPAEMVGSWAGELGQTQFLPTHYLNHAVDYDGDGRRNLMKSVPDIVGSSAAFIKSLEWRAGEPWLAEVRVPAVMAWEQADLNNLQPHAFWTRQGVTQRDGRPLAQNSPKAALVLPMGRLGPAFLAYPNFQVYLKWNQSLNYALTAAHLAARLAGAPEMSRGTGQVMPLSVERVRELQRLLARAGHKIGEVDGKLGYGTRAAVRGAQLKAGLPADAYPTEELIVRLGGRRPQTPPNPLSP